MHGYYSQFGYACDSADGQLARLRYGGSAAAEWLDPAVDAGKILSLISLLSWPPVGFFHLTSLMPLLVAIRYCVVGGVFLFVIILNEQLKRVHGVSSASSR